MNPNRISPRKLFLALLASLPLAAGAAAGAKENKLIERGRYLVLVGNCNDCHTPGFAQSDGKVPEKDWLTGDKVGFRGGWGTTYPTNLRRYFSEVSEKEWLLKARHAAYRPPMPSPSLRAMTDQDLKALYHFVRSLGPSGDMSPAYVPPAQQPAGPVIQFPLPPA